MKSIEIPLQKGAGPTITNQKQIKKKRTYNGEDEGMEEINSNEGMKGELRGHRLYIEKLRGKHI